MNNQKKPEVQYKEAINLLASFKIKVNRNLKIIYLNRYFDWKKTSHILKSQILFLKYWFNFKIEYV